MRSSVLLAALLLTACGQQQSRFEEAKSRYEFLRDHGASRPEMCEAARIVEAAAADERRVEEYKLWRSLAYIDCRSAELGI